MGGGGGGHDHPPSTRILTSRTTSVETIHTHTHTKGHPNPWREEKITRQEAFIARCFGQGGRCTVGVWNGENLYIEVAGGIRRSCVRHPVKSVLISLPRTHRDNLTWSRTWERRRSWNRHRHLYESRRRPDLVSSLRDRRRSWELSMVKPSWVLTNMHYFFLWSWSGVEE